MPQANIHGSEEGTLRRYNFSKKSHSAEKTMGLPQILRKVSSVHQDQKIMNEGTLRTPKKVFITENLKTKYFRIVSNFFSKNFFGKSQSVEKL